MSLRVTKKSSFLYLARSVAYQQLAGKAAATIWGRAVTAVAGEGGDESAVTPSAVLATPVEALRAAGLSGRKVEFITGLAEAFSTGKVDGDALTLLSEAELEQTLVELKGIGPWSAHMFSLFALGRADCLPWGDYGVRKAYAQLYKGSGGKSAMPSRAELEAAAEPWRPYRSLAAWYLWRSLGPADAAPPSC